jgi:hypothetical protein
MARQQRNVAPASQPEQPHDDTLLIRSAESLGRVIGSLQQQLKAAVAQLPVSGHNGSGRGPAKKAAGTHVVRRRGAGSTRSASRDSASSAPKASAAKKPAARATRSRASKKK